jgi:hypothetical protein
MCVDVCGNSFDSQKWSNFALKRRLSALFGAKIDVDLALIYI